MTNNHRQGLLRTRSDRQRTFLSSILILTLISSFALYALASANSLVVKANSEFEPGIQNQVQSTQTVEQPSGPNRIYIPVVRNQVSGTLGAQPPKVNVPYFDGDISLRLGETAIFWFGTVYASENYADVRMGYNQTELFIRVSVFDRFLWYDKTPSVDELTAWDAVSFYVDTHGNTGSAPGSSSFRFTSQLSFAEPRTGFQTAYQGENGKWAVAPIMFTDHVSYRGDAPNNTDSDSGWSVVYHIPFSSLGLSGPPPQGNVWGLGVILHDRDDPAAMPLLLKAWPTGLSSDRPATWGELSFGLPSFQTPNIKPSGTTIVRHKLDGAVVTDAAVGGFADCGSGLNRWLEWGNENYAGDPQINIQNQIDYADFPCFSKYYINFPLESVPSGAVIVSAKLTLYQFSQAGGGVYGTPPVSLIQVFTIADDWDEATITWNNAPLAKENVSRAVVEPVSSPPPQLVPRTWEISQAVVDAHASNSPLRLALYSADLPQHTGKYFYSSDAADWIEAGRPTLEIIWGYQ